MCFPAGMYLAHFQGKMSFLLLLRSNLAVFLLHSYQVVSEPSVFKFVVAGVFLIPREKYSTLFSEYMHAKLPLAAQLQHALKHLGRGKNTYSSGKENEKK